MKFSTRTTYGLRAMVYLAQNQGKENLSLASIARAENISPKYLERIFARLKKAGLVSAEKGVSGGYQLAREPQKITLYDIVKTLEGNMSLFYCLDDKGKVYCGNQCNCAVTEVLAKVQNAIAKTLAGIKLKDLYYECTN